MLQIISEESIGSTSSGQVYLANIHSTSNFINQQQQPHHHHHQYQANISSPNRISTINHSSSLPSSPLPFLGLTFSPPQSFRCSPVDTNCDSNLNSSDADNQAMFFTACLPSSPISSSSCSKNIVGYPTPSISVTDECGFSAFPIIPPPHDFAHHSPTDPMVTGIGHFSDPNIDLNEMDSNDCGKVKTVFPKLHRWKDGNKALHHSSVVI